MQSGKDSQQREVEMLQIKMCSAGIGDHQPRPRKVGQCPLGVVFERF